MKKLFWIGVILILVGGLIALTNPAERFGEIEIPEAAQAYFATTITERAIEKMGVIPIEGFDADLLMGPYPGFIKRDFDGVQTFEGVYRYADGQLTFERLQPQPVSSAERTISEEGYETLLDNVRDRLQVRIQSEADINALLEELMVLKTSTFAGVYEKRGETWERFTSERFGVAMDFRIEPNGYVKVQNSVHDGPVSLVFEMSLFDIDEYAELQQAEGPREGPPSINLSIFRNDSQIAPAEWVTTNRASNYQLLVGELDTNAEVGGVPAVRYQWDGLYVADVAAVQSGAYMYLFSGSFADAKAPIRDDFEAFLKTVSFTDTSGDVLIRVIDPAPGAVISNPLTVRGEARGPWWFEANAPLVITDWDGRIIGQSYIEAQGDWMTENFVPFQGSVEFQDPVFGDRGALILQKANPSGLPEHDAAIEIPIRFSTNAGGGSLATSCSETGGTWLAEFNECEYIGADWCSAQGGAFTECESACRHDLGAEACTLQCVPVCSFE